MGGELEKPDTQRRAALQANIISYQILTSQVFVELMHLFPMFRKYGLYNVKYFHLFKN